MATQYPQFDTSSYVEDLNIDRRLCRRTVPMEVLSLGMSRSGTAFSAAMKVALHILGYNDVYHFLSILSNVRDAEIRTALLNAKYAGVQRSVDWRAEFDGVLGHCAAVTDAPTVYLGPELIRAYPSAKVILVEREMESWVRSYTPLTKGLFSPFFAVLAYLDPKWMGRMKVMALASARGFWRANNEKEMLENLRPIYKEHYASIREAAPIGTILEYKLGSGWEPLCEFLGKDVPDVPFPKINEAHALEEWISMIGKRSMLNALKNLALLGSMFFVVGVALYTGIVVS